MFESMQEIQEANRAAGDFWFSEGTMSFFDCKLTDRVKDGRFFVTSEKPPHGGRKFTVRSAADNGTIKTVSDFCIFDNEQEAWDWLEDAQTSGEV